MTSRKIARKLWKAKENPTSITRVPNIVAKRTRERLAELRPKTVEVANAPPYKPGRKYKYRLTKGGKSYGKYWADRFEDNLKGY